MRCYSAFVRLIVLRGCVQAYARFGFEVSVFCSQDSEQMVAPSEDVYLRTGQSSQAVCVYWSL